MKTIIINSTNVVAGSNNSRFRYNFVQGGFEIKKGDKLAVASVSVPYSFFNVNATNNNMSFSYSFNGTTYPVNLKAGFYQLSDLNFALQQVFIANGHYTITSSGNYNYYGQFVYNSTYYSVEWDAFSISLPSGGTNPNGISLSGNIPLLIISGNNFGNLIGFNLSTTFPATTQTTSYQHLSDTTPNITPVQTLILNCNIVSNPQSISPNSVLAFSPNTTFGSNIVINPSQYAFIDTLSGNYNSIDIFLTDQNNNNIVAQDGNVCIQLVLKSMSD